MMSFPFKLLAVASLEEPVRIYRRSITGSRNRKEMRSFTEDWLEAACEPGIMLRFPISCHLKPANRAYLAALPNCLNLHPSFRPSILKARTQRLRTGLRVVTASVVELLLEKWCLASGAKFNLMKTNIIPIGTEEYCKEVVLTRKTAPGQTPLPGNLHIANEGEAIRILGAWFGNKINSEQVWVPVLEKIDTNLARWAKSGPTMEGRRHIIQMIIGGMTQYLTVVQGMPEKIEKRLIKRISAFLWKEKGHNPVSQRVVSSPIERGGRKVLDIKIRNEAIKVMWLKAYLSYGNVLP